MALATVNLTFDDDFVERIDFFANNASMTRAQLIYNSVKMYMNDVERLQDLYAYGKSFAEKKGFTESDVFTEIEKYRNNT